VYSTEPAIFNWAVMGVSSFQPPAKNAISGGETLSQKILSQFWHFFALLTDLKACNITALCAAALGSLSRKSII